MFKKEIITSLGKYLSVLTLICSLIVLSAGCEKKAEKPEGEKTMKDTTNMAQPEQQNADTTVMAENTQKYPDLIGTWSGSFQSHAATLKVTEQQDENFKANLSVAYREPMNKVVNGTIDLATNKITMKDDVKSRYESTYNAKLSEDLKKITGSAFYIVDKKTVKFNFTKK